MDQDISEECSISLNILPPQQVSIKLITDLYEFYTDEQVQICWEIENIGNVSMPKNTYFVSLDNFTDRVQVVDLEPLETQVIKSKISIESKPGKFTHIWQLFVDGVPFGEVLCYTYNVYNPFTEQDASLKIQCLTFISTLSKEDQKVFKKLKISREIQKFFKYKAQGWDFHIGLQELVNLIEKENTGSEEEFEGFLKITAKKQCKSEKPEQRYCGIF